MAVRRLFSIFINATRQPNISIRTNDSATQFLPSLSALIRGGQVHRTQTRRFSQISSPSVKNAIEHKAAVAPVSNAIDNLANTHTSATSNTGVTFTAKSNLKISPRHDLAMMFTCKVCDRRSVKTISRESYDKGVVVARCGGCNNYHLIADHLGMFGEKGNIEDILAARGEEVRKGNSDTLNLTLEDLVGMAKS
ncbi:Mitochondrial import protein TIM15 [Artemisia annua]|uniref:Mitochondrial import protein TIM15 n=1 Tax=Artemisia annua TaxID=35608 RepID=A0A2U1MXQ1_ARTAN|nr:Mitochondrial import protein TIM15 [Artemisia annua]